MVGEGIDFYQTGMSRQAQFIDDELSKGRVEICRSGEYRAVCADSGEGWDHRDAMVICNELGFSPYGKCVHSIHPCIHIVLVLYSSTIYV